MLLLPGYILVKELDENVGSRPLSYVSLLLWYLIFQYCKAIVAITYKWVFVGKFREGRVAMHALGPWANSYMLQVVSHAGCAELYLGTPLYAYFLKAWGATVGSRCCFLTQWIFDYDCISIGDRVVLLNDVSVFGHTFGDDGTMEFAPTSIGSNVNCHSGAFLTRMVQVEDGVTVMQNTCVLPGEVLAEGSVW
eukprot:CAMPEP_0119138162 /NCGR_PEP_ID=MMETSP1310-20130426/25140_1 /TAXON_ID=464262 /ORGANISM="Genus nov. species nov., Strain RCC2339" /LENGTH=192 /DNA_ID=CAMNT_0007129319 /DNA_START=50 /DNA_END=625 /DNA_ORIENTATION=+